MPEETPLQRRDKAMFALWVMTGARASALATLRIKHVDLVEGLIFQDGREVGSCEEERLLGVGWEGDGDEVDGEGDVEEEQI